VQAVFIQIADPNVEAAHELAAELRSGGVRFVEVDDSDNRMQNKIRLAQGQKVPYMLILGDREVEARTVTVRRRGAAKDAPQEALAWAELAPRLAAEIRERRTS
jgi:threonyl-tRNA synthetase